MGCLNSDKHFEHTFGNIHLSGPCNRACYFCIGQHMMALDSLSNIHTWPLKGLDEFIAECVKSGVTEINLTGTNTDPMLYVYTEVLKEYINVRIPDLVFGVRTNGALITDDLALFDKGSVTICSFNPEIHTSMMGRGEPADLRAVLALLPELKVNIVLGPENVHEVADTVAQCFGAGVKQINLREPYGQPHVGNPFERYEVGEHIFGMPTYHFYGFDDSNEPFKVTYWDVHYCEVESINLYASGRISRDYPITRGHADTGTVKDQSQFEHGRHNLQWVRHL